MEMKLVQGSGFRVQGSGFRVQGTGFRVQGSGFRVQVAGVQGLGAGALSKPTTALTSSSSRPGCADLVAHKALKLIIRYKLTFDERVVARRVASGIQKHFLNGPEVDTGVPRS